MSRFIKIFIALSVLGIFFSPISVSADEHDPHDSLVEDAVDFIPIDEPYNKVEKWKEGKLPTISGVELSEGWFEYEEKFYKLENGVIVKSEEFSPSNLDFSNGKGDLEVTVHYEEGFESDIGVVIRSLEEGVEGSKVLSPMNGYKVLFQRLPAGNYTVPLLFDGGGSNKFPTELSLDYRTEIKVEDGKLTVLDIYTEGFYGEKGYGDKIEKLDKAKEELENQKEETTDIKGEVETKDTNWSLIITALTLVILSGIGFLGYKAYKHIT